MPERLFENLILWKLDFFLNLNLSPKNMIDFATSLGVVRGAETMSGAKHSTPGSEISEKVRFRKLADISVIWYDFQLEISTKK